MTNTSEYLFSTTTKKIEALAEYFSLHPDAFTECDYGDGFMFTGNGRDYLILTETEMEAQWNEALENYIEEYIIPEIERLEGPQGDGWISNYFDSEKWKREARMDGCGQFLATYDGHELELDDNLYAYRTN